MQTERLNKTILVRKFLIQRNFKLHFCNKQMSIVWHLNTLSGGQSCKFLAFKGPLYVMKDCGILPFGLNTHMSYLSVPEDPKQNRQIGPEKAEKARFGGYECVTVFSSADC